jgi:DNA primase
MQPSEEIKSRLDIVDVIREYIQLKPAGVNFKAKCPFHREKTPSFMVSPEKQIWHCFGCGKGGDIFNFIMEIEGVSFVEALRILAPKAGVALKKQDPTLISTRNRLLDIMELARKYYNKFLLGSDQAKAAREYLARRGLDEETIIQWQIGYSPDEWERTSNFFKKQGYREKEIFQAGLSVKSEKGSRFYDRFRGRIMFPINDINGNTVAFSARVSPEKEGTEKMGKYINSPQTIIYDKSRILFGLDKAKLEIKRADLAILVEGQMDVITSHQHGFKNTVASSGTALTAEQINILKRYSPNIALAFDADEAGSLAADRGIREAMAAEMNIKVIIVPNGKDPDECIRKSPEVWHAAVTEAKPMMQYYFDKVFAKLDLTSPEGRREAAKALLPMIAKLGNRIEQDIWLQKLSEKIDVAESLLRETISKTKPREQIRKITADATPPVAKRTVSRNEKLSELFLALLLRFPVWLEYAVDRLLVDQVAGAVNQVIYKKLVFYYNNIIHSSTSAQEGKEGVFEFSAFKKWLCEWGEKNIEEGKVAIESQLSALNRLSFLGEKDFYGLNAEVAKSEIIKIINFLKKDYLLKRMREIEKMIAETEKAKNEKEAQNLMAELKVLHDELKEIEI